MLRLQLAAIALAALGGCSHVHVTKDCYIERRGNHSHDDNGFPVPASTHRPPSDYLQPLVLPPLSNVDAIVQQCLAQRGQTAAAAPAPTQPPKTDVNVLAAIAAALGIVAITVADDT